MKKPAVRTCVLLAAAVLLLGAGKPPPPEIGVEEALAIMKAPPFVLLDVRTPEEYAQGHIEGARLFPLQELEWDGNFVNVAPTLLTPVIAYCRTGVRSARAQAYLWQRGYGRVYSLAGGIQAWQAAGQPLATGPEGFAPAGVPEPERETR